MFRSSDRIILCMAMLFAAFSSAESFVVPHQVGTPLTTTSSAFPTKLAMLHESESSLNLGAATVDPTSFLTDIFGNVIGTPLILAIPIVAGK